MPVRRSVRSIVILASACFVATVGRAAAAQHPAAIEHHLRYGVRVDGQPDVAMELLDRMRSYHVPGVSIAVIDNERVAFAKGYGVAAFGGSKAVDTTTLFLARPISQPVFASGFLRPAQEPKLSLHDPISPLPTS